MLVDMHVLYVRCRSARVEASKGGTDEEENEGVQGRRVLLLVYSLIISLNINILNICVVFIANKINNNLKLKNHHEHDINAKSKEKKGKVCVCDFKEKQIKDRMKIAKTL